MYVLQKTRLVTNSMDEALEILDQIREQVGTCCAVTMYPEDVEELIDKLEELLIKLKDK